VFSLYGRKFDHNRKFQPVKNSGEISNRSEFHGKFPNTRNVDLRSEFLGPDIFLSHTLYTVSKVPRALNFFFLEHASGTDFIKQKQSFLVTKDWPVILELPAQSHKHKRYSKKARERGALHHQTLTD